MYPYILHIYVHAVSHAVLLVYTLYIHALMKLGIRVPAWRNYCVFRPLGARQ